jgi:uncharacterized protein (TIGR03437 family)
LRCGTRPISNFWFPLTLILLFTNLSQAQTQVAWTFEGPAGSADRIIALAVDPRNDSVIYAAAPGGGIWKSTNAGAAWAPIFDSQPSLQMCSIAIDPRAPDIVYAGTGDDQSPRTGQGVVRSADGGATWTPSARITNRPVCALAVDPTTSSRVYAGSEEGLFVSSDSGANWTKTLSVPVTSIAFGSPGVIYAGILGDTTPGLRQHILTRSSDGGRTWTDLPLQRNQAALNAAVKWVSLAIGGSGLYVAVSYDATPASQLDFYGSADGGNLWYSTFNIGPARPPTALLIDSFNNIYLAGTYLQLSGDGGSSWVVVRTRGTEFHTAANGAGGIVVGGEKGIEQVYFGGIGQDLAPFPVAQIVGVTVDSAKRAWAGGPSGLFGFFPSSPYTRTGVRGTGAVGRVAAVQAGNTRAIYAAGPSLVTVSTDGGATFSSQAVIEATELRAKYPPLVVDPVNPVSAFVAGRRVYHTPDSGTTWTQLAIVDPDPTRVVISMAMSSIARSTMFAATACLPEVALTACPSISVIWRSTNAGQTWTQMSIVAGFVNKFAIDPRQPTRVYAAIGAFPAGPSVPAGLVAGDLLLSTNNGGVWTSQLGNLPHTSINSVVIDPASLPALFTQPAQTIYVGTDAGVFVSFDAGTRWVNINSGLPTSPVTDLALLQPDAVLVAATFGRGVYTASVAGLTAGLVVQPLAQDLTLTRGATTQIGIALSNLSTSNTVTWQLNTSDSWITLTQPSGDLRPLASSQIPVAISAANLQIGTYIGRIQLSSVFGVQNIVITARVTPTPAQLVIAAGNNTTGLPGDDVAPLQVVVYDEALVPLAGVPVAFTITAGGGSLNAREVDTNSSGIAGVILTLPQTPASVQIVATAGALSVTFTVTALAAPTLLTDSIFDAVTYNANTSFGPGTVLAISGENLAQTSAIASESLPTSLALTRVLIATPGGDVALPLFSVTPTQITALMPFDVSPGRYMLRAEAGSLQSNPVEISVAAFDPGIFTLNGSGRGPGIFVKSNGSIVSAANAADRGSLVSFFAAGLGAVSPALEAGQPGASAEPLNRTIEAPRVFFDRFSANVIYSGLAPGIAGRYFVTVQVPASVSPATNVSVSLTIGGFTSNRVTIPVR